MTFFFLHPSRGLLCFSPAALCSRIPGLSPKQKKLCIESPDAVVALGAGHVLGSKECQYQFKGEHNCFSYLLTFELMIRQRLTSRSNFYFQVELIFQATDGTVQKYGRKTSLAM